MNEDWDGIIDEEVAKLTTKLLNDLEGRYINPRFVSRNHVVKAFTKLSHSVEDANFRYIRTWRYDTLIRIQDQVFEIHISGLEEPIYARYDEEFGYSFTEYNPEWVQYE